MRNRKKRQPRSYVSSRPTEPESQEGGRSGPTLLPTVLWAVGALVGLAALIGLLAVTLPHGFPPRGARAFIGVVILLTVITLALGAKGLEAYLKWREARTV